ncbi:MAG: ABATE domain-containing protein [Aigarchaeota archaeon]|nr:ABATE domain-containing protein [Aigarchaeota archaeon]
MPQREMDAGITKLIGGWLCLDFANTVDWHGSDHPEEGLNSYSDLISWSRHVGILTDGEARQLLQEARLHPKTAKAVLERAITLREAVYQIFSAIASHISPNASDLTTLNTELHEAMTRMQIMPTDGGYSLIYAVEESVLDQMLWPISRSAADLLTSDKLERISKCSAKDCGWLFLDMSRNRSRRWCDMKDCGNRAKARRHYQRKRVAHTSSH